jgi:hypothetical protein
LCIERSSLSFCYFFYCTLNHFLKLEEKFKIVITRSVAVLGPEAADFFADEFPSEAAPGIDGGGGGCEKKMK